MSRFDYHDDGGDIIPPDLWEQATKVAFHSKRGLAVLREVEAALLALPHKRLIRDRLASEDGDVCLVGAFCARKVAQRSGASVALSARSLAQRRGYYSGNKFGGDDFENETDIYDTVAEGQHEGMRQTMAWTMADQNDNTWHALAPEQRYDAALEWVRGKIDEATHH